MNKKELLESIRTTQKSIADTMESLQYNINDLDEIRKTVILSVPDDVEPKISLTKFLLPKGWTKEDSEMLRGGKE